MTLSTMAFAIICVYGGLILTLSHVLFRRPIEDEEEASSTD